MPTGYTNQIKDDTTLKDFAIICARAFGACIEMRDDPLDKPIPEKFEGNSYYHDSLKRAKAQLANFKKLDNEAIKSMIEDEYNYSVNYNSNQLKEKTHLQKNYERVLLQVKKWTPPSDEHKGLKDFMIQQIKDSIKWDCDIEYCSKPVIKPSIAKFKKDRIKQLQDGIEYDKKHIKDEQDRLNERNNWIKLLRESL